MFAKVPRAPVTVLMMLVVGLFALYRYLDLSEFSQSLQGVLFKDGNDKVSTLYDSKDKRRRLPKALIIGFNKCGTTALRSFLTIHPDVVSPSKETRFFIDRYSKGLDWYRKQMPKSTSGQITLEKTPGYIKSLKVLKRIHQFDPKIKLIAIVRNPVSRLLSQYAHNMHDRSVMELEPISFEKWLRLPTLKKRVENWSDYAKHIQHVHRVFGEGQLLIISEEEFEDDPLSVIQLAESFLGLRPVITEEVLVYDQVKGFYCFNKTHPLFPALLKQDHHVNASTGCMDEKKGRKHPDIEETLLRRIVEMSRPYVEKLFLVISRRLKWDYYWIARKVLLLAQWVTCILVYSIVEVFLYTQAVTRYIADWVVLLLLQFISIAMCVNVETVAVCIRLLDYKLFLEKSYISNWSFHDHGHRVEFT